MTSLYVSPQVSIFYKCVTVADSPLQETFAKRLKAYAEATEPLLEHYDKAGVLWTVRGKTSDEITPQLDAEIQRRFA